MGAARNQEASAKTERTLASTHCFSLSVMMPASRRQLALKDMKEAEGASLIGKISSRFTGDSMALSALIGPFFSLGTDWGAAGTMSPTGSSCHLYFGAMSRAPSVRFVLAERGVAVRSYFAGGGPRRVGNVDGHRRGQSYAGTRVVAENTSRT